MTKQFTIGVAALVSLAGAASAQQFIGTNNLAPTIFGTPGDQLISFDFSNPGGYSVIGVLTDASGAGLTGIGGLDYNGDGSVLYAADSFGSSPGAIYSVNDQTAQATLLGNAPAAMNDLAWNPVTNDLYGTDGAGNLWANLDDPTNAQLVGAYSVGGLLEVGLGFDSGGNVYVHDLITDTIYTGNAGSLLTLSALQVLPFDSNFSQGLYVDWNGDDTGYHAALNNSNLQSENYTFGTQLGGSGYNFVGAFPIDGGTGLPEVEVGDLTMLVPTPSTFALLGLGGLVATRRRR